MVNNGQNGSHKMFRAERLGMLTLAIALTALAIVLALRGCWSETNDAGAPISLPIDTAAVTCDKAVPQLDAPADKKRTKRDSLKGNAKGRKKAKYPVVPYRRDHLGEPAN